MSSIRQPAHTFTKKDVHISMKKTGLLLVLLVSLFASPLLAQPAPAPIATLAVDLWPDYDRPAVLVLLTGTLAEDALLPADVTIPLPPGAELNAVARITDDNVMTDDIAYRTGDDGLTLTTPDSRFRVEYYLPYETDGDIRSFDFNWQAAHPVAQFLVAVQQPVAATSLQTEPAAATISQDELDGLTYHFMPSQTLAAQQPYSLNVTYEMPNPALSANQPAPDTAVSPPPPAATGSSSLDWPLLVAILGGLMIVAAIIWQVSAGRSKRKRPSVKPKPLRPPSTAAPNPAGYCHECGTLLQAGDKFCRHCGTAVKNKT